MPVDRPAARVAYFDCSAGASGDMLLAALVDAGASLDRLRAVVGALGLGGEVELALTEVRDPPVGAVRLDVRIRAGRERQVPQALERIAGSGLSPRVRERSRATLLRLAEAESRIHAVPLERLHLHELSAADTLVDVVGFHAACEELALDLIEASVVHVGGGTVTFSHGTFAVPPPAVADLLRDVPTRGGEASDGELVTPTGAAILVTSVARFGPPPALRVERIGRAIGSRPHPEPRILTCVVGIAGQNMP